MSRLTSIVSLEAENLDHLARLTTASADMTAEVVDGSIISRILSKTSDTSSYSPTTDSLEAIRDKVDAVQGGTQTLESIGTDVKGVLDLTTTAATATMDGSEDTLFEFVPTSPSMFEGGSIDLTNMAASDTIVFKIYQKIKSGGNYIKLSDDAANTYADAQDPDLKVIDGFPVRYGVKITAEQTAGTNRALDTLFTTSAPGV